MDVFPSFLGFLCNLVRKSPRNVEKIARFAGGEKAQNPVTVRESRDDNKNKICVFQGGGGQGGREENCPKAIYRGKRRDNKILKVKMLLSRNFVVMAQAPTQRRHRFIGPDLAFVILFL